MLTDCSFTNRLSLSGDCQGQPGNSRFRGDGHVVGEFWRFRSVAPVGEILRGGLRLFQCRSHKRMGR